MFQHMEEKKTNIDALEWAIEGEKNGAGEILLTSMNADGTKHGYDIELTSKISNELVYQSLLLVVLETN